jgi:hypothetical protein
MCGSSHGASQGVVQLPPVLEQLCAGEAEQRSPSNTPWSWGASLTATDERRCWRCWGSLLAQVRIVRTDGGSDGRGVGGRHCFEVLPLVENIDLAGIAVHIEHLWSRTSMMRDIFRLRRCVRVSNSRELTSRPLRPFGSGEMRGWKLSTCHERNRCHQNEAHDRRAGGRGGGKL